MRTLPNDPAQGMTKREYFAVTIAAGLAVGEESYDSHLLADDAIHIADALLELLAEPTVEDQREAERAHD